MERKILKSLLAEIIGPIVKESLQQLVKDELASKPESYVDPDIGDIKMASKILGLSEQTIYQNIKTIPHYKINGRLRFKRIEMLQYIENNGKLSSKNSLAM